MNKKKRFTIVLILALVLCGSTTAAVADTSISGALSSWITSKSDTAIEEIDEAIQEEQANQTERLQEVLAEKIGEAEEEWDQFVEEEKEKRVRELQGHADHLIENYQNLEQERKAELENDLNGILEKAIEEMENLTSDDFAEEGGED
jgi:TolA-binding protein